MESPAMCVIHKLSKQLNYLLDLNIRKCSSKDAPIELYKDIEYEPLVLHTLTWYVCTCQITCINEWLTFDILIELYKDILIGSGPFKHLPFLMWHVFCIKY